MYNMDKKKETLIDKFISMREAELNNLYNTEPNPTLDKIQKNTEKVLDDIYHFFDVNAPQASEDLKKNFRNLVYKLELAEGEEGTILNRIYYKLGVIDCEKILKELEETKKTIDGKTK